MVLSGSSMILIGIFLRYSDLFLKFLFGTSLYGMPCQTCILIGADLLHSYLLLSSCVPFVFVLRFVRAGLCLFVGNYCNGIWYTTPALSSLGEIYMSCLRVLMG